MQKNSKFVATEPGQHIKGAQLVCHAGRHFQNVQVAYLVAVERRAMIT
jgi:hypothetical protein